MPCCGGSTAKIRPMKVIPVQPRKEVKPLRPGSLKSIVDQKPSKKVFKVGPVRVSRKLGPTVQLCPACGAPLRHILVSGTPRNRMKCSRCGQIYAR